MARHYFSTTAVDTTLVGSISNSALSMEVASSTGFPSSFPYYLTLRRESSSREVVEVTAAAGNVLTIVRARSGTSAVSHSAGAAVTHDAPSDFFNETSALVNDAEIAALAALDSGAGLVTQTGAGAFVKRSVVAANSKVTVTNPSGTAGNVTIGVAEANFTGIPNTAVTAANGGTSLGNDVVNLDTRVDALEADSGWLTAGISAATGWSVVAGSEYRKYDKRVEINVNATRTGASLAAASATGNITDTDVLTLPASYRPVNTQRVPYQYNTGSATFGGMARIDTAGLITIQDAYPTAVVNNGGDITITCMYFSD